MRNYFTTIFRRIHLLKVVRHGMMLRRLAKTETFKDVPVKHPRRTNISIIHVWNKLRRLRRIKNIRKKNIKTSSDLKTSKKANFNPQYKFYRRLRFLSYKWRTNFTKRRLSKPIPKSGIPSNDRWIIFLNSAAYFLLAYIFQQFISQAITTLIAAQFDFPVIMKPSGVYFNITADKWTMDSVKMLFSIQPVTSLIYGIIMFILSSKVKDLEGSAKLFLIWSSVLGFSGFFGALFFGTLLSKGFGHVLLYLYLSDTTRMILSILAGGLMISMGVFVRTQFLMSANIYYLRLPVRHIREFVRWNLWFPMITAVIIIIILRIPDTPPYEMFLIISPLILMLPSVKMPLPPNGLDFGDDQRQILLRKWVLIISLVILLGHRLISGVYKITLA
ncbi:MAG: hypothetical protein Q7J34_09335 [Bacteroidales bacterium]|nr:hypothetical protein [Bacteroidales bacterium]